MPIVTLLNRLSEMSGDRSRWAELDEAVNKWFFAFMLEDQPRLRAVFDELPEEWFDQYPRHRMSRAIVQATERADMLVGDSEARSFQEWKDSQTEPAARDVLGEISARLRPMMVAGRFGDADVLADAVAQTVFEARDTAGFPDAVPPVLVRAGNAKILVDKVEEAIAMYTDALRWSGVGGVHPMTDHVRSHLGLAYALSGNVAYAERVLPDWAGTRRAQQPGMAYHYESAGILARLLIALARLDEVASRRMLERVDETIRTSQWWWVPVHARAVIGLYWGDAHTAIAQLERASSANRALLRSPSIAQGILLADLVDLHLADGDLAAAERVLGVPGLDLSRMPVVLSSARMEVMRGRPTAAARRIADSLGDGSTGFSPSRGRARLMMLAATADTLARSPRRRQSLAAAITAVHVTGNLAALVEATSDVRESLQAELLLDRDVPALFEFTPRSALTAREREVLAALRMNPSTKALAASLHVSPNTAKTHLRALYQKLGVHTREQALWLVEEG